MLQIYRYLAVDERARLIGRGSYEDSESAILAADHSAPWPTYRDRIEVRSERRGVVATRTAGRWSGPDACAGSGYLVTPEIEARARVAKRPDRFRVHVFGRVHAGANLGSIDITHGFASRRRAEHFAREIASHIPAGRDNGGCPLAWVMVEALPDLVGARDGCSGHYYLTYERNPAGGAVFLAKRHPILHGHHGFNAVREASC